MPRLTYVHLDDALGMTGYLPPTLRPLDVEPRLWAKRLARAKSEAATQMEREAGLRAHYVTGKRARRYRLDEVEAAQARIIKPIDKKAA